MRIAYCEDEAVQGIFLKEAVEKWEMANNHPCEISLYKSAEEMLFENSESFPFDFIILDIELDKMNGIELARRIRTVDAKVMIAFLSNSREYVFDGYEVQAVRYLLKPVTPEQLFPLLDQALMVKTGDKQYLIIKDQGDKVRLEVRDILYVESFGHYVSIHTAHNTYEVKMNINEITKELGFGFIATHRSFIVNLLYVQRITRTECILKDGWKLPISRNSYMEVNQAFIDYYKGGAL